MEQILLKFIETLDELLKTTQARNGSIDGFSKLTINQLRYLETVGKLGIASITQIAESLNYSKASVTVGINKLIKQGYVTKSISPVDRRVVQVALTSYGQTMFESKRAALDELKNVIDSVLTIEEVEQFSTIINKLTTHFSKHNRGEE